MIHHSSVRTFALSLVGIAALAFSPLSARAMSTLAVPPANDLTTLPAADAAPAPTLETREFHLPNAPVTNPFVSHQEVTAWQVTQGSWNGQSLAGLSLVLVHSTPFDTHRLTQTNCYISVEATTAQRSALLNAFIASNPAAIPQQDASSLRIEPAAITIQFDGHSVTLHLGKIA